VRVVGVWPSEDSSLPPFDGTDGGPSGEENLLRDRHYGDLDSLACGSVAARAGGQSGGGSQDDPQVPGAGGGGWHRAGRAARSAEEWAALVREWFPQLVDTKLRQVTWPQIEVHRDYIVGQLEVG
jgi:hypothetical protein